MDSCLLSWCLRFLGRHYAQFSIPAPVSSCPWGSMLHVRLKADPWLRKGRGIPGESEKPHTVRGSGVTTSTQLQGTLSIHPSSGWMPLREKEPTYYSSHRISQTQSPQRGYWRPPQPGSCLRGEIRHAAPLLTLPPHVLPSHVLLTSLGDTLDSATPSI